MRISPALLLVVLCATPSFAAVSPTHLGKEAEWVVAAPGSVRSAESLRWHEVPVHARRAWRQFQAKYGSGWTALWDRSTGVPARIIGPGLPLPSSTGSAPLAAAYARTFLADNLNLLAPGSTIDDFALIANDLDGGLRTVAFGQFHRGLRVHGGQLNFRIKNDRLFVIGAESFANLAVALPRKFASNDQLAAAATAWIASAHGGTPTVGAPSEPLIFPLVTGPARATGHVAVRLEVSLATPRGKWAVYLDASTAEPLARQQLLRFAAATLGYDVPVRHPGAARTMRPAPFVNATVGGAAVVSSETGQLSWAGEGSSPITTRTVGTLVRVLNESGPPAELSMTAAAGALLTWSRPESEAIDAQLATYIHAGIAKTYARTFAPSLAYLSQRLDARVNIDDECNAYSDGETINFYRKSDNCQNTGTLADVIYHEFGHSIHIQSIIDGVGNFDSAFSEGASDYFAATITNDSGMGRGFFFDDEPLRELDPPDDEARWPGDIGEVHKTGIIFGGAMWDVRKALQLKLGGAAGVAAADSLFYATLRRASNIPTSYVELLAADDDDGDLANGTPNECEILSAYNAHGIGPVHIDVATTGVYAADAPMPLQVTVQGESVRCPNTIAIGGRVRWAASTQPEDANVPLEIGGAGLFAAELPAQADGTLVRYQIELEFSDGGRQGFPGNPSDIYYQLYVGEVVPLYCTDFETDPFAEGWVSGLAGGSSTKAGANDWQWGPPSGAGSSGDPTSARSGVAILGNDLGLDGGNGYYEASVANYIDVPVLDVGNYTDVHLQFWRWLNVEDGFFDQARIMANGSVAWENANSDNGDASAIHHLDSEWRFQDLPVSQYIADGNLAVRFELWSDQGLEIGGWNLDDFCIVAAAGSVCGDGQLTGGEQCDDGAFNSDSDPDACRTSCRFPVCGDAVVDSGEECDDGNTSNIDECTASCVLPPGADEGGGCGCATGSSPGDAGAGLLLLGLAGWLSRRRRAAP